MLKKKNKRNWKCECGKEAVFHATTKKGEHFYLCEEHLNEYLGYTNKCLHSAESQR